MTMSGKIDHPGDPDKFEAIVTSMADHTTNLLVSEYGIPPIGRKFVGADARALDLHFMSTLVGIGGHIDASAIFSFDKKLIREITKAYIADLDLDLGAMDQADQKLHMQHSAGDLINNVIGNCTRDFQQTDQAVHLTPPFVVHGDGNLLVPAGMMLYTLEMTTIHDCLSIHFFGPEEAVKSMSIELESLA